MNQNIAHIVIIVLLAINTLLLLNHTTAVRHEAFVTAEQRAAAAAIKAKKPNVQSTANRTAGAMSSKASAPTAANRVAAKLKQGFTNEYFEGDDDEY
jgi:GDP-D-mannose dehydratase